MNATIPGWTDARHDEGLSTRFRRYWRKTDSHGYLIVVRTRADSVGRKARCSLYGPSRDGVGQRMQIHADTLKGLLLMWTNERLEGRW